MTISDTEKIADPPKKKKALPFKRTVARRPTDEALAKPGVDVKEDNNLEFFRRRKEVLPIVVAEVERRAEKKKSRTPEHHERKRRKVSPDSEDGSSQKTRSFNTLLYDSTPRKEKAAALDDSDDDIFMDDKGKGKEILSPAKTRTPHKRSLLDDDSDEDFPAPSSTGKKLVVSTPSRRHTRSRISPPPPSITIDDEEECEKKPKLEDLDNEPDADIEVMDETEASDSDPFSQWEKKAEELEAQNHDVPIKIMVTSQMEGTYPMMVKRRPGQGMKLVLKTWIAQHTNYHQIPISEEVARELFLTWKGKKIYNHTTPNSLGVRIDSRGTILGAEGEGYDKGGIHLEVWREHEYNEYIKEKEKQRAMMLGLVEDVSDPEDGAPSPEPEKKKKGVKVVLKAKDREPVRCMVHDDTSVAQLVTMFRQKQSVPPHVRISIHLDGEQLDEDSLVTDADLDPDETNQLEVHLK